MNVETVKEKIKKLLALAQDGNNDHESYVAFQQAQKLMAKYKLEHKDISKGDTISNGCIKKKTSASYGTRSSDHYLDTLANIIAENFCCVNFISTMPRTQTHYIWFMGLEEDVNICEEVLYAANNAIIRGYNRVYKDMCKRFLMDSIPAKLFRPYKNGYVIGYLDGLEQALKSQKEEINQEWGLVLVAPKEAKEFIGEIDEVSYGASKQSASTEYYKQGYSDGRSFNRNKKLNNNSVSRLTD